MEKIVGIFKAYDIRGVAGTELSVDLAYKIGRTFVMVKEAKGKTLIVGRDMRPDSPAYAKKVIEGMRIEGANVVDAGMISTSLFYYAAKKFDGGCMITASHNPPKYNGFKFVFGNLPVSYKTGIKDMELLINESDKLVEEDVDDSKEIGTLRSHDYLDEFLQFNLGFLKTKKEHKIVIDAGNGMGGYTYSKLSPLLRERGITMVPIFFELDGSFPNHEANPLKSETLTTLKQRVMKEEDVTLGLALDGDGDRCLFIDEKGETINSDITLGLISQRLLSEHGSGTIIHDLRCSRSIRETIKKHGGKAIPSPVGYANIKPMAKEYDALLGGEISGHFFPKETGYNENTMFILFQILNLIEEKKESLSSLADGLRKYAFSGEINSQVEDADKVLEEVERRYTSTDSDIEESSILNISHLDGIRIEFKTWWFSLRKSNTEPVVRLIVEADTEEEMKDRCDELLKIIRS